MIIESSKIVQKEIVHMVENKEESLARARLRGLEMRVSNVWFYQCNLEFYVGSFSVGTSLHACGAATDLVMEKCMRQRAAVVSCPCCYGGVTTSVGVLTYPRSKVIKNVLTLFTFFVVDCISVSLQNVLKIFQALESLKMD